MGGEGEPKSSSEQELHVFEVQISGVRGTIMCGTAFLFLCLRPFSAMEYDSRLDVTVGCPLHNFWG